MTVGDRLEVRKSQLLDLMEKLFKGQMDACIPQIRAELTSWISAQLQAQTANPQCCDEVSWQLPPGQSLTPPAPPQPPLPSPPQWHLDGFDAFYGTQDFGYTEEEFFVFPETPALDAGTCDPPAVARVRPRHQSQPGGANARPRRQRAGTRPRHQCQLAGTRTQPRHHTWPPDPYQDKSDCYGEHWECESEIECMGWRLSLVSFVLAKVFPQAR